MDRAPILKVAATIVDSAPEQCDAAHELNTTNYLEATCKKRE
jgi:hypothetical protein